MLLQVRTEMKLQGGEISDQRVQSEAAESFKLTGLNSNLEVTRRQLTVTCQFHFHSFNGPTSSNFVLTKWIVYTSHALSRVQQPWQN